MKKPTITFLQFLLYAIILCIAPPMTHAADGEKLINMAKVTTGGLTPGDAAGFPVTISQPGSYKLTGNLTVPNANTNAIVITSDHVTVNLNGFAILGPTDCSGGLTPCANAGNGKGISTTDVHFNISIRNGTVQGMGFSGIELSGDSNLVEYLHVRSNGKNGIVLFESLDEGSSIVQYNTVQRNGNYGIYVENGMVSHNVVSVNGSGILLYVGIASNNVITRNANFGLLLEPNASYVSNSLINNGGTVFSGINMGQNLCNNAVCVGSQY